VVEVALATRTAPRDWWDEDDETLATALELLQEQADAVRKAAHHRG
jgi:hypothetical protein